MKNVSEETTILEVKNLHVSFSNDDGEVEVLHGVNVELKAGTTLGLVGESGSGKSVTAMSIMGLLPKPYGKITEGEILYHGKNLLELNDVEARAIRGKAISVIFQDPMTALNPVYRIGQQIEEAIEIHRPELNKTERYELAVSMLDSVKIPLPEKRMNEYPHQLSGGMRQRVMIAMALVCEPEILICDEPTTALDVTIQAEILDLINELQQEKGTAVIFITHDLSVVAEMCDDVAVMYGGQILEFSPVLDIFDNPKHGYTKRLLGLMPSHDKAPKTMIDILPIEEALRS